MPSSRWTSARSRSRGSTASVAPIRRASSSRYGLRSVTTTWRAPAWRTTAAAMQPIGPAPVTSTSSPSTGNESAVCTALPNGSKIAATSSSIPGQWCQMFVIGSATNSANAPGPVHAEPDRVRAQVAPAGHAVAAAAADDVALAADEVADLEVADVRAERRRPRRRTRARPPSAPGSSSAPSRPSRRCAGRCRRSRSCGRGSGRR